MIRLKKVGKILINLLSLLFMFFYSCAFGMDFDFSPNFSSSVTCLAPDLNIVFLEPQNSENIPPQYTKQLISKCPICKNNFLGQKYDVLDDLLFNIEEHYRISHSNIKQRDKLYFESNISQFFKFLLIKRTQRLK